MCRWSWVGFLFLVACSRTPLFDLPGAVAAGTGGASGTGGGSGGALASGGSDASASGGSGGTAGTAGNAGAGGTAGAGGSGGYVYATGSTCFGFIDRGSRRFQSAGAPQTMPGLVLSSANGQQASLVYWHAPPQQPSGGLGQVAFAAWGGWPPTSLGQSAPLLGRSGGVFDLAPASGGHFAIVSSRFTNGQPDGAVVSTQATPGQPLSGAQHVGSGTDAPMFIARGSSDHLGGVLHERYGGHYSAHFARVPGVGTPVIAHSGCATEPVYADAVHAGNHYIVALSSSRDVGACAADGAGDKLPTRIEVVDLDDNDVVTPTLEPPAQGIVTALSMVGRSDGAWLVWRVVDSIFAARFDQGGNLDTLPNTFAYVPNATPFAVDRVADDLALAYMQGDPSNPQIRVQLFNADSVGSPHLDFTITPDPATERPTGRLAILGAPSGDSLLVSWQAMTDNGRTVVITRRLDCVQAN